MAKCPTHGTDLDRNGECGRCEAAIARAEEARDDPGEMDGPWPSPAERMYERHLWDNLP